MSKLIREIWNFTPMKKDIQASSIIWESISFFLHKFQYKTFSTWAIVDGRTFDSCTEGFHQSLSIISSEVLLFCIYFPAFLLSSDSTSEARANGHSSIHFLLTFPVSFGRSPLLLRAVSLYLSKPSHLLVLSIFSTSPSAFLVLPIFGVHHDHHVLIALPVAAKLHLNLVQRLALRFRHQNISEDRPQGGNHREDPEGAVTAEE